ncbi:MAG TPA: hypothetical protein VMU80_21970 [Bryobacteraceae bacterium]|nr:hypothetical protein [Bryobacteraceae bacterium]
MPERLGISTPTSVTTSMGLAGLGCAPKIDTLHQAQQQIRKKPATTAQDWAAHFLFADYL